MSDMAGGPERSDRAGEYVLGVMRGQEPLDFEAELARHEWLAAEVAAWERRLLPLALSVPAAAPPRHVWMLIEAAIASRAVAAPAPPRAARAMPPLQRQPARRGGLWRSLVFWRSFSLLAAITAIILAILWPNTGPPPPNLVALLQATPQAEPPAPGVSRTAFTVAMRPDGALAVLPVSIRKPPKGKGWELWAIAPKALPVPIGMIHARQTTRFNPGQMPVILRRSHVLIAVSVERPDGSPTGKPTGPVVFTGPLLRLD